MLVNIEGAIKKRYSKETGNIGYTRRRISETKHNMRGTPPNTNHTEYRFDGDFLKIITTFLIYSEPITRNICLTETF
jgi:hypothetical protein